MTANVYTCIFGSLWVSELCTTFETGNNFLTNVSETGCTFIRFKVFTAVTMKNAVFWDVFPSSCERMETLPLFARLEGADLSHTMSGDRNFHCRMEPTEKAQPKNGDTFQSSKAYALNKI
jgi:hypothetical protein